MLFKEEQNFNKIYLWMILLGSFTVMMGTIIMSYINGPADQDIMRELYLPVVLVTVVFGGMIWLFSAMRLETRIDRHGISYRYTPFIISWRVITKKQIAEYQVRKYNAVLEYGGYGVRVAGLRGNGRAYTTKGSMGLQLVLKNGKKMLFGTQKPQEVEQAMNSIMQS